MITFNLTVPLCPKRRVYSEYSGNGAKTQGSVSLANHAARSRYRAPRIASCLKSNTMARPACKSEGVMAAGSIIHFRAASKAAASSCAFPLLLVTRALVTLPSVAITTRIATEPSLKVLSASCGNFGFGALRQTVSRACPGNGSITRIRTRNAVPLKVLKREGTSELVKKSPSWQE